MYSAIDWNKISAWTSEDRLKGVGERGKRCIPDNNDTSPNSYEMNKKTVKPMLIGAAQDSVINEIINSEMAMLTVKKRCGLEISFFGSRRKWDPVIVYSEETIEDYKWLWRNRREILDQVISIRSGMSDEPRPWNGSPFY